MRVLITGALGFIGSHLAEAYLDRGDTVIGIDNLSANVVDYVDGMELELGDARKLVGDFPKVDLVVHAASPVGPAYLLGCQSIVSEIVETTQAAISYCRRAEVPLVNISTSEVYGFSGVYNEQDDCVFPHRLSHRIQYAAGKFAGEHLVRTSGLYSLTIRPFNIAGPRQSRDKGFVLPTFCEQAIAGEPLTVFEDGAQQRSFTAVYDLCDFIVNADPRNFPATEVVNVGNPHNRTTIQGLAGRVCDLLGVERRIERTSGKEIHGPEYEEAVGKIKVPDIALAESLGWEPRVGLEELIEKTATEVRFAAA